jgi:hypothetical protein
MNFVIVNYCPHCGAPIWIDASCLSLGVLPKTLFSCGCNPQKNRAPDVAEKPQRIETEITCVGSSTQKTILHD